jgi:hypothetical protein
MATDCVLRLDRRRRRRRKGDGRDREEREVVAGKDRNRRRFEPGIVLSGADDEPGTRACRIGQKRMMARGEDGGGG